MSTQASQNRLDMDAPEISVYGEAKGEYTRQLCVFLVPCLETYFLNMLEKSKESSPTPNRVLWEFQTALKDIPDWNQDKVIRETDLIQKDCKCDYLEELLTAVFIAHTKVLSAIRLTTRQKKLQISIPKLDHFLHRVLSECARSLWENAFLFADTNAIEKQKNLRQVSHLCQECVLQAIRGLLPVKSILKEYLTNDEDDEDAPQTGGAIEAKVESSEPEEAEEEKPAVETPSAETPVAMPESIKMEPLLPFPEAAPVAEATPASAEAAPAPAPAAPVATDAPTIVIDTKPSVSFTQEHVFFDSNSLEANEINDIPFAEAENREDEEEDEDDEIEDELDTIKIMDEEVPLVPDEILA
jgi:hypothetical protein